MRPVSETPLPLTEPDTGTLLDKLFDIPEPASDIYARLVAGGMHSTAELADELEYDRSTVHTNLDRLVTTGFLERTRLPTETGGFVNVYHVPDTDALENDIRIAISEWAMDAATDLTGSPATDGTGPS